VTVLFLGEADRLNDEQIGVFDDVLGQLIQRIETKALAELSSRLAPTGRDATTSGMPIAGSAVSFWSTASELRRSNNSILSSRKGNAFPFSKAALYRRRGGFVLHVYRASTDARELCITDKRDADGYPGRDDT
jgi:hypothetical protein